MVKQEQFYTFQADKSIGGKVSQLTNGFTVGLGAYGLKMIIVLETFSIFNSNNINYQTWAVSVIFELAQSKLEMVYA